MINVFVDKPVYIPEEYEDRSELISLFDIIFGSGNYCITTQFDPLAIDNTVSFITNLLINQVFNNVQEKVDQVKLYAKQSRLVFVSETEINARITEVVRSVSIECQNVIWLIPGCIVGADNVINNHWHVDQTVDIYKQLPDELAKLKPYDTKPKLFDALLGTKKTHRDFVYKSLITADLDVRSILKYHGRNSPTLTGSEHFVWEPGSKPHAQQFITAPDGTISIQTTTTHSTENVEYRGLSVRLSQILPIEVYNASAYSIITETLFDNQFSFYTEKIAKAILARRLFVVFSGTGYLQNLRQQGFQTFSVVIDETYDTISNDNTRFNLAMDQLCRLAEMRQTDVLLRIQGICDHNYNLLTSGQLRANMLNSMREYIL